MPALLTRTYTGPSRDATSSTAPSTEPGVVTSTFWKMPPSCTSPSFTSQEATRQPSCAKRRAVARPMPAAPPVTITTLPFNPVSIILCLPPNVSDRETVRERVLRIHHILRKPRDPRLPGKRRHHRGVFSHARFFQEASSECSAEDALVDEILVQAELSLGVQRRHLGAGAGAAGRAVHHSGPGFRPRPIERSRGHHHGVLAMRLHKAGRPGELSDADAGDARVI